MEEEPWGRKGEHLLTGKPLSAALFPMTKEQGKKKEVTSHKGRSVKTSSGNKNKRVYGGSRLS